MARFVWPARRWPTPWPNPSRTHPSEGASHGGPVRQRA